MDSGLLIARIVVGLLIAAHGSQKLFGWFGGYGIAGTGGFFETIGFAPGRLFAAAAGFAEFAGGLLIAFGFLGPIAPAAVIAVMVVAAVAVHWGHLFAMNNGVELPLLYAAAGASLALTGYGRYSLDAALGLIWTPLEGWLAVAVGIALGFANLAMRKVPAPAPNAA